ncbi:AAA family ATPase (plasmid) [Diaphorobacter sp. HDW4A]|uniref:AAA family ATPase n=1 Tax=Diaphorobacter sp. HDW4A TaxID=2714924 RepID=UPI001408DAEF|nr:AAA family ATPase [Diaphorobacter sp. HDW4A]QIL84317.1 AAA family ATPase [Diaphorobacter sp. HDW4A]
MTNTHNNIRKDPEMDRLQAAAFRFLAMRQEEEANERALAHKSPTHAGARSTPSTDAEMLDQTEAEPGAIGITANCDISTSSGAVQVQTAHVHWQRLGKEQEVAPFPVIHMAYQGPTHSGLADDAADTIRMEHEVLASSTDSPDDVGLAAKQEPRLPDPTLPPPFDVSRTLPTHTSEDFEHMPRLGWLVREVFHGGEVIILWGESQAGKTALLLDMVAAVASGADWAGHPVTQTNVIYVALEGQLGLRTRVQALEHDRGGLHQKGIRYVFDACNVASTEDVDALAVTALKHQAKFIVIDTLSASLAGTAEENSNSAMAGMIANVQRLTRMTGAAVLLVHHSGNDPRRGARGAYALHANPDVSIEVGRNGNERYWRLNKGRDGSHTKGWFRIEPIEFQPAHETEPLQSIVIRHVQDSDDTQANDAMVFAGPKPKTQERTDVALQAIRQHLSQLDLNGNEQRNPGEATEETIRKIVSQAFKEMHDSGEEGYGSNHRAENVREAIQSLVSAGQLLREGGKVRVSR